MINTNKIKGRAVELNLTQKDCADYLNIAQATYSQKINNIRPMDLIEAEKLAELLKISADKYGEYFFYTPVAKCNFKGGDELNR